MHKKLVEAALFMTTKPLGLDELAKVTGLNSLGFVKQVLEELQKEYETRGMEIVNTPDGWLMQAKQEFLPKIAHLTPYHDLSEGTKRTLALVVYKEPIRQSNIIKTQGNKAYSYIKDLVKRGLVRAEKDGRTKLLYLTPEFERYFGEERTRIKEKMDIQVQKETQEKIQDFLKEKQVQETNIQEQIQPEPKEEQNESEKVKEIKSHQTQEIKHPVKEAGEIIFENLKKTKQKTEEKTLIN